MASPFLNTIQLASGYLNDTNDPIVGKSVNVTGFDTGYKGQLGKVYVVDTAEALKLSKTSIGTLFGGAYQQVLTLSTSTQAFARGQAVFWSNRASMIVTADPGAGVALGANFAGICLQTVTRGNYCWIQIWGKASALWATPTETAVIGDPIFVVADTVGKVNNIADATVITPLISGNIIGRAMNTTATGIIDLVDLDMRAVNY